MSSQAIKVVIYDPPMCCPSGLCGPNIDESLLRIAETIEEIRREGFVVERYMITQSPQVFQQNEKVLKLLRDRGIAALPIVEVNGRIIKIAGYPSLEELRENGN